MNIEKSFIAALALVMAVSPIALAKDKKGQRGMLESMQSVPCGARERGVTGLGSVFGSVGVEHVNSHEQLCAQYLLRTDQMDYHIRPLDTKHAAVLPIGQEAVFKIKKDHLFLKVADGDKETKKERAYQVVSMQPSSQSTEGASYHSTDREGDRTAETRSPNNPPMSDGNKATGQPTVPPPQPH